MCEIQDVMEGSDHLGSRSWIGATSSIVFSIAGLMTYDSGILISG